MIALSGTPVLETDRLILRAPQASDWPVFRDFLASDRARFIRTGDFDLSMTWRSFGHIIGHWVLRGFGVFVWQEKAQDAPLGMTGPWRPETWPEQEIAWSVWNEGAEGKGLATEAAIAARAHAFDTLGWETAVSYIHPDNARSANLARKLGAILDPNATPMGECHVYRHTRNGVQA